MTGLTILGPVAMRSFTLARKCEESHGHAHNYDHVTFVQSGAVQVFYRLGPDMPEKESREFKAGDFFLVKAEVYHRIKATQPDTRYACVFTHRDFDGAIVQEYNGNDPAYNVKQEAVDV